jgi:hypothetical protein
MSRTILLQLAPFALLLIGCVTERGPIGHFSIPGERGTEYKITPDTIADSHVSVSRVENGKLFRGFVRGSNEEVEARIEGDMIKGTRGSMPINVKVEQTGNEIVARGYYGGKQTAIHILHEPTGSCAFRFDEREAPGEASTCTSQRSLPIPPFMGTWPKEEQALFITIALSEAYGGPTATPNQGPGGWGMSFGTHH